MLQRLLYCPFLVQMVVTRRCNLSCGYCNEYDAVSKPIPRAELERRIDAIKRLGTLALELTGGEPMLHPEIYELIAYARRKRFVKVMMISNAYLFNEQKVRQLNEAGLQWLQVSVDGTQPNDVTVKVLKPLRGKLEMLARVAKFKVVISAVLGSSPPSEALEVVRFAKQHGFIPRVLVLHDGDGQMKMSPEEVEAYQQVGQELGRRFTEANDYRSRILHSGSAPFKCRAGSRYLYVDEFGRACWCSQTRQQFGIPLEQYGWQQLREQFYTYKGCNERCTLGCARTASAYDQWRAQGGHPGSETSPATGTSTK